MELYYHFHLTARRAFLLSLVLYNFCLVGYCVHYQTIRVLYILDLVKLITSPPPSNLSVQTGKICTLGPLMNRSHLF